MRKFIIAGVASLLTLVSIAGLAQAKSGGGSGPNHGQCTAYYNGQKKGWSKNGTPGPFLALESNAENAEKDANGNDPDSNSETNSNEVASDVFNYCDGAAGNIGGNPDQNGRYASCFGTDANSSTTFSC